MEISQDLLAHLARLSRLQFSQEELQTMQKDLGQMTDFVAQLQQLDTAGVPPLQHMAEHRMQLHQDFVAESPSAAQATAQAANARDGYFLAPKVIDK